MTNYPTAWQRRVLWTVFTYAAIVGAGVIAVWLLAIFGQAVGFLQPVLIPFALAAVLAFLLDPIVRLITARTRLSRTWSVFVVMGTGVLLLVLLLVSVVPRMYESTANMVRDLPAYTAQAQKRIEGLVDATEARINKFQHLLPKAVASPTPGASPDIAPSPADSASPAASAPPTNSASPAASAPPADAASPAPSASPGQTETPSGGPPPAATGDQAKAAGANPGPADLRSYIEKQIPALQSKVPAVLDSIWHLLFKSLGAVGTLIDGIIIPVYLFFLLSQSHNIARRWSEYLPIRDSPFKKEVVSVLLEINGYIVAFFRGQLLVSTIDAILIGGALAIMGLDFAFFIGLLVLVLTFIPYLGIILCYIPAILVAIIQYGDFKHPLIVVAIMFGVQTAESTIISPKIVGDSVGLHPVTVIFSVFGWSLLLNGPIGAILAVPLSATVKVLLRRYVWEPSGRGRHFVPVSGASAAMLEDEVRRADESTAGKTDIDGPRRAGSPVAQDVQAKPDPTSNPLPQQDQDH